MEMTLQALATERRYSGFERGWKEGSRSRRVSLDLVSGRLEKHEFSTGSCGSPTTAGNTNQRHAEIIVEQLGLKEAKAVETPQRRRRIGRQRRTPRS